LIYTVTGGEFMPTATLTHAGALVLGVWGVRRMGVPRGSAWNALAAYLALWLLTRALTPASANVNLAFHVHPGWEDPFSTYPLYFATLFVLGALSFVAAEVVFRQIPRREDPAQRTA
jgi:hypothetical protein